MTWFSKKSLSTVGGIIFGKPRDASLYRSGQDKIVSTTIYSQPDEIVYFLGDPNPHYVSELRRKAQNTPVQLTLFDYDEFIGNYDYIY